MFFRGGAVAAENGVLSATAFCVIYLRLFELSRENQTKKIPFPATVLLTSAALAPSS